MMTATKTVQELAAEMSAQFETKKRSDDTEFVSLKDGHPEWMQDVCREAHGEFGPDDFRYAMISEACDWISESECDEDSASEFADQTTDVYTGELTAWQASSLNRVGYVDQAAKEFGTGEDETEFNRLQHGQYMEREEVFNYVVEALEKIADED